MCRSPSDAASAHVWDPLSMMVNTLLLLLSSLRATTQPLAPISTESTSAVTVVDPRSLASKCFALLGERHRAVNQPQETPSARGSTTPLAVSDRLGSGGARRPRTPQAPAAPPRRGGRPP